MTPHKLSAAIPLLCCLFITSCTATTVHTYRAAGQDTICGPQENHLGSVAVLPEAAWRANQKEPQQRALMAMEEIKRSFQALPCGSTTPPGGVKDFSNWSSQPESELIAQFSAAGVDTIILLRIEELTPRLNLTFSIPFLWVGSNEADFRIRALSTQSGAVITDMRIKRATGGPFNIRPADWSGEELAAALANAIQSK